MTSHRTALLFVPLKVEARAVVAAVPGVVLFSAAEVRVRRLAAKGRVVLAEHCERLGRDADKPRLAMLAFHLQDADGVETLHDRVLRRSGEEDPEAGPDLQVRRLCRSASPLRAGGRG